MSVAITVLVAIEAVVIVLLAVLVVGLLRSHAEILRVLHDNGMGLDSTDRQVASRPIRFTERSTQSGVVAERTSDTGVHDITGITPAGETVR